MHAIFYMFILKIKSISPDFLLIIEDFPQQINLSASTVQYVYIYTLGIYVFLSDLSCIVSQVTHG